MNGRRDLLAFLLAMTIWLLACGPNPHRPSTQGQPILDLARAAQSPNPNAGLRSEGNLTGIERVPTRRGDGFFVAARTQTLEGFPCSRCHDRSPGSNEALQPG